MKLLKITTRRHLSNVPTVPGLFFQSGLRYIFEAVNQEIYLQWPMLAHLRDSKVRKGLRAPKDLKPQCLQKLQSGQEHLFAIYGKYILFTSGREYGTSSLKIHIKSCKEKW